MCDRVYVTYPVDGAIKSPSLQHRSARGIDYRDVRPALIVAKSARYELEGSELDQVIRLRPNREGALPDANRV